MRYGELLKSYIKSSGLSLSEISEKLIDHGFKVTKSYISQLQNGKTENPASPGLNRALANVTGGDVEALLTAAFIEKAPDEIKEKFTRLEKLKTLRDDYKQAVSVNENTTAEDIVKVPVLKTVSADQSNQINDYIENVEYITKSLTKEMRAFGLRVKEDNMVGDNIIEGDTVICVYQENIGPGDIAVVSVENQPASLKKLKYSDGICVLMTSNPKQQPLIIESEKVRVIGRVIEVRRKL